MPNIPQPRTQNTDNHETRISVLEANHATLKESLSDIRGELHGLRTAFDGFRTEIQELSEQLIKSFNATQNCQTSVIPLLNERIDNHETRLAAAETELNDSRAFKGAFRAWKGAFIVSIVTTFFVVLIGAVKLATEMTWLIRHGGK